MDHYELVERAFAGEVIGDGVKQIAAMVSHYEKMRGWSDHYHDCFQAERKTSQHWEGKHSILRHENNRLRRRNEINQSMIGTLERTIHDFWGGG